MELGLGCSDTRATSARRTRLAGGRVDPQVLDLGHAVAGLRGAPDHNVVGLAVAEDVADLLAGDQGGGRSPDVAGFEAVPRRLGEVDLHLQLRDVGRDVDVLVLDTLDAGQDLVDLLGLGAEHP